MADTICKNNKKLLTYLTYCVNILEAVELCLMN